MHEKSKHLNRSGRINRWTEINLLMLCCRLFLKGWCLKSKIAVPCHQPNFLCWWGVMRRLFVVEKLHLMNNSNKQRSVTTDRFYRSVSLGVITKISWFLRDNHLTRVFERKQKEFLAQKLWCEQDGNLFNRPFLGGRMYFLYGNWDIAIDLTNGLAETPTEKSFNINERTD